MRREANVFYYAALSDQYIDRCGGEKFDIAKFDIPSSTIERIEQKMKSK